MRIPLTATFSEHYWESDEPDTDPIQTDGFTDPTNPWGGFQAIVPDGLCGDEFVAWRDENIDTYIAESLSEAVHFVLDFPGAVWDYQEGDYECVDYSTGTYREVTLHVSDEYQERVFKWAAIIEKIRHARRCARN